MKKQINTIWTHMFENAIQYSKSNFNHMLTTKTKFCSLKSFWFNVFYHYFVNYHYFVHSQTLFFIFSPRRRQRQRQQYEVFQKIFFETSLTIAKIYHLIISVQNKQTFQLIGSQHSTFTFWSHSLRKAIILEEIRQKAHLLIHITSHRWRRAAGFAFLCLKDRSLEFRRSFPHLQRRKHWNERILKSTTIESLRFRDLF